MDTENIATSAVNAAISKTTYLSAFINEKDKEPCWDGHIYIYSDKRKSKENIKRVPVQVKGISVNTHKIKEHITYRINRNDLIAYKADGGVIFFVVYINKNTGDPEQIYYAELLPERIKRLLKNGQDSQPVKFKKFPASSERIEDLFLNFYDNSKKQVSFAHQNIVSPFDFARGSNFKDFSFSISGMHQMPTLAELPRYLEDKSLSIYGHLANVNVPIPVDYIDEVHDIEVRQQLAVPILVNDIKYYDTYCRCYFKDKIVLQIGSCVTITINEDKDGKFILPYQVDYKVAGTLSERIEGLQFVMAAIQNKGFSFGAADFSFNDDDGFKSFNMDNLVNTLKGYKKAKKH